MGIETVGRRLRLALFGILGNCCFLYGADVSRVDANGAIPAFQESFEKGLPAGWTCDVPFELSSENANSGERSLHIRGKGTVTSSPIPIQPHSRYRLVVPVFADKYSDCRLRVQIYNRADELLSIPLAHQTHEWFWTPGSKRQNRAFWLPLAVDFDIGEDAAYVRIKLEAGSDSARIWIDDIVLAASDSRNDPLADPPPAVDVPATEDSLFLPGPDGRLYPNFSRAGLTRPWQVPEAIFPVEKFGAVADDGKDDSDAIEKAVQAASANGGKGGVVQFGAGRYRLTRNITVHGDHVVLSGVDRGRSILELGFPDNQVGLFLLGGDNRLAATSVLNAYFPAEGAQTLIWRIDGREVDRWSADRFKSVSNTGFASASLGIAPHYSALSTGGRVEVSVEIIYADGRKESAPIACIVEPAHQRDRHGSSYITFSGLPNAAHGKLSLAGDLRRGGREFVIAVDAQQNPNPPIKPGDYVELGFTFSDRWAMANNAVPWWKGMRFFARVASVKGDRGERVELTQSSRLDFLKEEGAYIRKVDLIRGSGMEKLTLEQAGDLQAEMRLRAISFYDAAECRAAELTINRPGAGGIYGVRIKNCEFSDCRIDRPWNTKALAYMGWDYAWDCLMDRVETKAMRHAPLFNWCSSGNVVTGSSFEESDAQWHTGWCHDNLIENSRIVTSTKEFGSYGWAYYAVPYDDGEHGAIGPRNVVYNCESESFAGGIFMGGLNRDWMIVYNKIVTSGGPGALVKIGSGGNIFAGNVFVLKDPVMPMIYLESINGGDVVEDNRLFSPGQRILGGPGKPEVLRNNRVSPLPEDVSEIGKPQAPVPSLYRWQRERYFSGR